MELDFKDDEVTILSHLQKHIDDYFMLKGGVFSASLSELDQPAKQVDKSALLQSQERYASIDEEMQKTFYATLDDGEGDLGALQ